MTRGESVFVDQAEGNRRALICASCPHNVIPAGKGWLQNWADGKMLKSVEDRITESHEKLGVCEVCSCELRAAVWWQPDIIVGVRVWRSLGHRRTVWQTVPTTLRV